MRYGIDALRGMVNLGGVVVKHWHSGDETFYIEDTESGSQTLITHSQWVELIIDMRLRPIGTIQRGYGAEQERIEKYGVKR